MSKFQRVSLGPVVSRFQVLERNCGMDDDILSLEVGGGPVKLNYNT